MEPRLVTEELTLCACSVEIARAVGRSRAHAAHLSGFAFHQDWPDADLPGVLESYAKLIEAYPDKIGWGVWLFVLNGVVIGDGGFHGPPKDGRVEIGYSIVPEHQRRGYATQAVRALCGWAFGNEARLIAASCVATNLASMRVLERCGFAKAGSELTQGGQARLKWELRPGFQPPPRTGK